MTISLTFIHTIPALVDKFDALARDALGDVQIYHVVDAGFAESEFARGVLSDDEEARLLDYVRLAEKRGDDAAVVTCSFLGTSVDKLHDEVSIPWLRVDEEMGRRAMAAGSRIGVIATAPSSLESTVALIQRLSKAQAEPATAVPWLCKGAFEALQAGDADTHDEAVREGLRALASQSDVIVLSQASMARVAAQLDPAVLPVPVLSSPDLCMAALARDFAQPAVP
ncbi:aspartate/glutamate racemase family protein [Microbacterium sediminicola]|uniref:Aspartate/glutamate racemase family protein n=1 Tax=Microbacterium sediminicola TaxID=415210 RepID=A0ABP4UI65_9MICO